MSYILAERLGFLRRHRVPYALAIAACCAACGTAGAAGVVSSRTLAEPAGEARAAIVMAFAKRAYGLAQADRLSDLLLDDLELRDLLRPQAATRIAAVRHNSQPSALSVPALGRELLVNSEFAGVCLQGLRTEPPEGLLGLSAAGWVFDRMLLVGSHGVGGRVALWVEGTFVRTDTGVRALMLERAEAPRREHADLELALCDLRLGGI